jgi:hypothetical protein
MREDLRVGAGSGLAIVEAGLGLARGVAGLVDLAGVDGGLAWSSECGGAWPSSLEVVAADSLTTPPLCGGPSSG